MRECALSVGRAGRFRTQRAQRRAERLAAARAPARTGRRAARPARARPPSRSRAAARPRSARPSASGVETGAPGFGRTEYTDAIVLPQPFWRWSTSTPARFFFSHSVVTSPGCSASSRRASRSANSYVSSKPCRRAIGTSTWMPSAPLVFTYERRSSSSSAARIRCATRTASGNPSGPSGGSRSKSTKSGRSGRSTREYHAFMSMQCICTIQSSASGELTSGKSTSRDPPSRGQVSELPRRDPRRASPSAPASGRTRRPASPSRQRFIVNGRSRRCGTSAGATAR